MELLSELLYPSIIVMISKSTNTYVIVEDAMDVCHGLKERMNIFENWTCLGIAHAITHARSLLEINRPHLIFMDWDIQGGSTYELLDWIQQQPDYQPYIIFFTAFQADEPSIPVEVHNSYRVDKYLIKPFWSQLSSQLKDFVHQAALKANSNPFYTFRTEDKQQIRVDLNDIVYVAVFESDKRTKSLFLKTKQTLIVRMKLDDIEGILNRAGILTLRPNRKFSIINPRYISSYKRPVISLLHTQHTLEVSNDLLAEFEIYIKEGFQFIP